MTALQWVVLGLQIFAMVCTVGVAVVNRRTLAHLKRTEKEIRNLEMRLHLFRCTTYGLDPAIYEYGSDTPPRLQ